MLKDRQLTQAIVGYLLLFWAASVCAADSPFVEGIRAINREVALGITLAAGVGGMGATLHKMAKPDQSFRSVPLEVVKDVFAAQIMGWLAFFATTWSPLPAAGQIAAVIVAGVCSSKTLDKLIDVGPAEIVPFFIQKLIGKTTKDGNTP